MSTLALIAVLLGLILGQTGHAGVATDASLGPARHLGGPEYAVTADLGRQAGPNLFHSFAEFNLGAGETADFSGPAEVRNIVSRVTGGTLSTIDGTVRSSIAGADLYLFNPHGIAFGPHARLDLSGSFHAAGAAALHFADGSRFDAVNPVSSSFTAAAPEAFGFVGAPAAVSAQAATLAVPAGRTLGLSGGEVRVEDAYLLAPQGEIYLQSSGDTGDSSLSAGTEALSGGTIEVRDSTQGTANLQRFQANLDVSGDGGGRVWLRGGRIVFDNAYVYADTHGDGDGRGIEVSADRLELRRGARLTAESVEPEGGLAHGDAGPIHVAVRELVLQDGAQIATTSHASSFGQAGDIRIEAESIVLSGGMESAGLYFPSGIIAHTLGRGEGGDIEIQAGALSLGDAAVLRTDSAGLADAGAIRVEVDSLRLENGGQIDSSSGNRFAVQGDGNGGEIAVTAHDHAHISGVSPDGRAAGVLSNVFNQGRGGAITITAPVLRLEQGASIASGSRGSGDGGRIEIRAEEVSIERAAIVTNTERGTGDAGSVAIHAERHVDIADNAVPARANISSVSLGRGKSGEIVIVTPSLVLRQQGRIENTTYATGAGNTIRIKAAALELGGQSKISARTHGTQAGGSVEIHAEHLLLDSAAAISAESLGSRPDSGDAGSIALSLQGRLVLRDAAIRTRTEQADGGDVRIDSTSYVQLRDSEVTTSVAQEDGDGGNVTLTPEFLVLDNSRVIARAVGGNGGNIRIVSTGFYRFSTEPLEQAVNASSKLGIDGQVEIHSPEVDIAQGLVVLPVAFIDRAALNTVPCRLRRENCHFFVVFLRGIPFMPDVWTELSLSED